LKTPSEFLVESAKWAAQLSLEAIPSYAMEAAKVMMIDTIAAAFSSMGVTPGRTICRSLREVLTDAELLSVMSVLLDHDSTLLYYGHLGHSVVSASLFSWKERVDGRSLLEAVIAAVEVGARLAASLSFSRVRGQMLSIVHSLTTATALGKLKGMPAESLKNAMSLSLAYVIKPTSIGFTTSAKILTAVTGLTQGIRSYKLAEAGHTGSPKVFESLYREWGGLVLKAPLGGYGERWHIETLSIKPWPACSYAQTAIEATLKIAEEIAINEIKEIVVEENILTYLMDKTYEQSIKGPETPFTSLQFYTPYLIAYTLTSRSFGREAYEPEAIRDYQIWRLVRLTKGIHNKSFTARLLTEPLPFGVAIGELGTLKALALMFKLLGAQALPIIAVKPTILKGSKLEKVDFHNTKKLIPVRLKIKTRDRQVISEADIVKGFHGTGNRTKLDVALNKLYNASKGLLEEENIEVIRDCILKLEKAGVDEVAQLRQIISEVLRC